MKMPTSMTPPGELMKKLDTEGGNENGNNL